MKILLAPDSFKGSLTAREAASAMREGLLGVNPELDVMLHPMADGGEGTLDVLAPIFGGSTQTIIIPGMDGSDIRVPVQQFVTKDYQAAWLVESARIIGLTMPSVRSIPVWERSSAPLGCLIHKGVEAEIHCFYLALGGSATNDGGIGMLSELGLCLKDGAGVVMTPVISSMPVVRHVDVSGLHSLLRECNLHLILDVDNPLLGEGGATRTYGPQKGLKANDVNDVEEWMHHWSLCAEQAFGRGVKSKTGSGAAGGLGFALMLMGAKAHAGASFVATLGKLEERMSGCDWVITGEGRSDAQTLHGKVPAVVADLAHQVGARVALLSGQIDKNTLFDGMFDALIQASPENMPMGQATAQASELLMQAASGFILSGLN